MRSNNFNFFEYSSRDNDYKRERAVTAALELLFAEAQAGIRIDNPQRTEISETGAHALKKTTSTDNLEYNPVKKYADWIEEALEIPDGKSNPPPIEK